MTQHTKGPWRRSGRFVYALGTGGTNIFSTNVQGGGSTSDAATPEEMEANARLIAAAPEMIKALHDALHALEAHLDSNGQVHDGCTADYIRAAIAKAETI